MHRNRFVGRNSFAGRCASWFGDRFAGRLVGRFTGRFIVATVQRHGSEPRFKAMLKVMVQSNSSNLQFKVIVQLKVNASNRGPEIRSALENHMTGLDA
jgi:hypothetical protein